jgi:hypothetical protein
MEGLILKFILSVFLLIILIAFFIWLKRIWDNHSNELEVTEILLGTLTSLLIGKGRGQVEISKSPNTQFGVAIIGSIFILIMIVLVILLL